MKSILKYLKQIDFILNSVAFVFKISQTGQLVER